MKDATGELSTTVITIVAIAAILAVFTAFLLPTLRRTIALNQACSGGPSYVISEEKYFISCGNYEIGDVRAGANQKVCTGTAENNRNFVCYYSAAAN